MKIGVYVGSFDPFHKGHESVVNHLLSNKYLDKVIIIPTLSYWDKRINASINDRINMIKILENNNVEVNTNLNNLDYTYQILDKLKEKYNEDNLYLIIGADSLIKFNEWKEVTKILENNILVIPRNNIDMDEYINTFKEKDHFVVVEDFNGVDISSTKIRELLLKRDYRKLEMYLNNKILDYIIKNNLYC